MKIVENNDYYADAQKFKERVWIECGTNWFHYANDNRGHAILSKEDAKKLAEALLEAIK